MARRCAGASPPMRDCMLTVSCRGVKCKASREMEFVIDSHCLWAAFLALFLCLGETKERRHLVVRPDLVHVGLLCVSSCYGGPTSPLWSEECGAGHNLRSKPRAEQSLWVRSNLVVTQSMCS